MVLQVQAFERLFLITIIHGLFRAFPHNRPYRFSRAGQNIGNSLHFPGGKRTQHIVGNITARNRSPDSDAHPYKIRGPRELHDGTEAVMTAVPAAYFHPYASERQIQLIVDHDKIGNLKIRGPKKSPDRPAAFVHIRLRLGQNSLFGFDPAPPYDRIVFFLGKVDPQLTGKIVHNHKPGVVSGAFVFRARVSEPNEYFHSDAGKNNANPYFLGAPSFLGAVSFPPSLPLAAGAASSPSFFGFLTSSGSAPSATTGAVAVNIASSLASEIGG